ncbi:MAG TPA: hypothetical protein DEP28_11860 [Bacteroidetes bacterium]|nr:hypothetical protein [Bacteroidota bacterium]HCN36639.1 hypothetical protein [Bacteroidota bacterium]
MDLNIPVKVTSGKNQITAGNLPDSLKVSVRGKGWDLLGVMFNKDIRYDLNLLNLRRDTRIYTMQGINERLNLPQSVTITSITPDSININFDNSLAKTVPVINNVEVNLKSFYQIVGSPEIIPDSVVISGPTSVISKIKAVSTEYKKFDNISENLSVTVKLIDTLGNNLNIDPSFVTINYTVELAADKEFNDIDVEIINVPQDREVLLVPPKMNISVRSGVEQLSKLNPIDIRAEIDFNDIENDTLGYVTPKIVLPPKFNVINQTPEKFQYIIKRK